MIFPLGTRDGSTVESPSAQPLPRSKATCAAPVYTENSDSRVLVVQSVKERMRYDASRAMS